MKKFTFILICALSLSYASAQATCTDIKVWLTRGMENNNVLALQNFLYDRGYLKAKPNGYFGVGTFAGVKAFQKSLGLEQVGSVGPGTRAAIKKATCGATTQSSTSSSGTSVAVSVQPAQTANVEQVYKPAVPVVNTPSGLRNAKRREDLEKLLKGIYKRYVDSRGEHPVVVTDTPIQLCVKPVYVMNQATATEVAVLTTPDSPCKDYVDIAYLSPYYMSAIPRDPSLATSSTLTGYTITRDENNQITLIAPSAEDAAIVKVSCNFNGYCSDFKHISTIIYKAPVFSSSSIAIVLRDATPKIPLKLYGKNFTATNTIELLSNYTGKKYLLGVFPSTNDGTTIEIPASSTNQLFPCGTDCSEKFPIGDYSFRIVNQGGSSNAGFLTFKGIVTTSYSAKANATVKPKTDNVNLGSIAISPGTSIKLQSIVLTSSSTSSVLSSKITNLRLKDVDTGVTVVGPSFSLSNKSVYENQSKIYEFYADISEVEITQAGYIAYSGTLTFTDMLTGAEFTLPVKEIVFTVSY